MTTPTQPTDSTSQYWIGLLIAVLVAAGTYLGYNVTQNVPSPTPSPSPVASPSPSPSPTPASGVTFQSSGQEKPMVGSAPVLVSSQTLNLAVNQTSGFMGMATGSSGACVPVPTAPSGLTYSVWQARPITTVTPSATSLKAGAQYDPLFPATQICWNSWYWIDVTASLAVAGKAVVTNFLGTNLTVNVASWTISASPSMPVYVGLEPMKIFNAHGLPATANVTQQAPILMSYVNILRAHRIEPMEQMLANPPVVSGAMNLDQWSAGSFRQTEMTGSLAPICLRAPTATTSSWASTAELTGWQATFAKEPLLANSWAYITDEPTDLTGTATRAQLVRTNAPSMKVMVTHEPTTALLSLVDHFTTVFEYFKASGHWADFSTATLPQGYWLYGGCMSHGCSGGGVLDGTPDLMLDEPTVNARAYIDMAYALGANGEIYYDAVYSLPSALTNQYFFGGNGDGNLLYACVAATDATDCPVDGALPSIRLKMMREGMNDIEWAKHLGVKLPITSTAVWSQSNAAYEAIR